MALKSPAAAVLGTLLCFAAGCGGGPYGHSRFYDPLSDEEDALDGAVTYDPVMADRAPDEWARKKVTLFGIVERRADLDDGTMDLTVSVRGLEGRNLCADRTEGSCRTTVSERENARIHVTLRPVVPEDDQGEVSIGPGSLVRAVGKLAASATEGGDPVLVATYYRHWPRGYYVTTSSAQLMRQ